MAEVISIVPLIGAGFVLGLKIQKVKDFISDYYSE